MSLPEPQPLDARHRLDEFDCVWVSACCRVPSGAPSPLPNMPASAHF
jgi:hypothetical protein